MTKLWIGLLSLLIVLVAGVGLIQGGMMDFAADTPHNPVVFKLIEWARERSVERQSADIAVPTDLSDAARIKRGAGNYAAMCASCHLAPAVRDSEIRKGLYPQPPDLARPEQASDDAASVDARRFWVIKHGIKGSGMPAWAKGGMTDSDIWDLTAFLKAMPALSPEQYRQQVEASEGHSHEGANEHASDMEPKEGEKHLREAKPHGHPDGADKH